MNKSKPKPIIAHVVRTWRVPPGMTYALVRDIEQQAWIVESCPAGTRFWTPEQAAQLPQGRLTRTALQAAVQGARELTAPKPQPVAPFSYELSDPIKALLEAKPSAQSPRQRVRSNVKTCVTA